jgi:hypothetical protein
VEIGVAAVGREPELNFIRRLGRSEWLTEHAWKAKWGRRFVADFCVRQAFYWPAACERTATMNALLWVLQVLLAVAFFAHGWLFLSPPPES